MITYSEISASGITPENYQHLTDSAGEFIRSVVIRRQAPDFTLHDKADRPGTFPFSIAADDTYIVRSWNDGSSVWVEALLIEPDDQSGHNFWSDPILLDTAKPFTQPKVVKQNDRWEVIVVNNGGDVYRHFSTDTVSWDVEQWCDTGIGVDRHDDIVAYGGGTLETFYFWKFDSSDNNYELRYIMPADGGEWTTNIFWPEKPFGMDCEVYYDNSDDHAVIVANSDLRHALVCSLKTPPIYTFKDVEGQPVKQEQPTGGLVSFIVRPHQDYMIYNQVSTYHEIQLLDNFNNLSFRKECHITTMNSVFAPDNQRDMMWVAAVGADGDVNGSDESFSYNALYYYASRDNKNWSQDYIVPIPDDTIFAEFIGGVQLAKLGNYVYLMSSQTTLRTPLCLDFGGCHPDWELDVTHEVNSISTSVSDMRQTTIELNNSKKRFAGTILDGLNVLALTIKYGKKYNGTRYLFQTSLEEIDTISGLKARPSETITIQSRDRMAWLAEKTQATDAVEYDNQITGLDNFHQIGGTPNSGLGHTAATSGTWGTNEGQLKLVSSYKEGVAFTTFEANIDNGAIEIEFMLPYPGRHDIPSVGSPSQDNQPTYAGVVFRAIDQDNFWWCKYEWYSGMIIVGYRATGVDGGPRSFDPGDFFRTAVQNEEHVKMRLEYKYDQIKVFTTHDDTPLDFLFEMTLKAKSTIVPSMMAGSVGYIACGFSDEDNQTLADEPLPTLLDIDLTPDSTSVPLKGVFAWWNGSMKARVIVTKNLIIEADTLDTAPDLIDARIIFEKTDAGVVANVQEDPWIPGDMYLCCQKAIVHITDAYGDVPDSEEVYHPGNDIASKIVPSINRQGYWCWIDVPAGDLFNVQIVFKYTTDYFGTVHAIEMPCKLGGDPYMPYFNSANKGIIWMVGRYSYATTDAPSPDDNIWVFETKDWGAHWRPKFNISALAVETGVSKIVPTYKYGGSFDKGYKHTRAVTNHVFTGTQLASFADGHFTPIGTHDTGIELGQRTSAFTLSVLDDDANYLNWLWYDSDTTSWHLRSSDNAGASFVTVDMPDIWGTGSYFYGGLAGFSSNPNWVLAWSNGGVPALTYDRGAHWALLMDAINAGLTANAQEPCIGGGNIINASIDFTAWFKAPVPMG